MFVSRIHYLISLTVEIVWSVTVVFFHKRLYFVMLKAGAVNLWNTNQRTALFLSYVSLWRRANARNVRLYYPYWQYTDHFIFIFLSLLCLRSKLLYVYFKYSSVLLLLLSHKDVIKQTYHYTFLKVCLFQQ